jgi:hypothetical protein
MELFKAHSQWSSRPNDERFANLNDLYKATKAYADASAERANVPYSSLRVEASNDDITLVGKGGIPANLTHWSFGQLSARVGAPAGYLREIPSTLACQNINYSLKSRGESMGEANLLFHKNSGLICRAFTSDKYGRIWNYEVAERLQRLNTVWRVPPARTDDEKPSGIYASDHDMFVFLVNDSVRIADGTDQGLGRGVFVSNSEVGAAALRVTRFLYRYVCGNHIVWGAKNVEEIAVRHVGEHVGSRMSRLFQATLMEYANESASDQEAKIANARTMTLGGDKDAVLDLIFGKRFMSRKQTETAYEAVVPEIDGDPKTVWGLTQGITRVSQQTPYADERVAMEMASAKVLALAF